MKLIVVIGATASGKTARAIHLAQQYQTEIISCDSRQFYSELNIGVARPTPDELSAAPHHFIACRSILEPYNVSDFEHDALRLLNKLFEQHEVVIAVGGSGLYIDALCKGISCLPDPTPALRQQLQMKLKAEGISALQQQLQQLDPEYYVRVDQYNPVRLQRALEVCITAGRPYSQVLSEHRPKPRPFDVEYMMIHRSSDELRERINHRVDQMFAEGLEAEARALEPLYRSLHLQALNTVGYKEFFEKLPSINNPSAPKTIPDWIKLNTWHYAKKQLTWFKKHNRTIRS